MSNLNKWDYRFLELAQHIAAWSKDPKTKVGCVIVNLDKQILATGYNGLPRFLQDIALETGRMKAPEKYYWIEHAERNAIYQAAKLGVSLKGCIVYTTLFPCCDCSRGIIQSGITKVVTFDESWPKRWEENFSRSWSMLEDASVEVLMLKKKVPHESSKRN
jgi:dCMP deaminase